MLLALWSAFFSTATPPAPVTVIGGGFDTHKYREYLEKLNGISRKDLVTAVEVAEIQKISKAIKVKAPEIKKAAKLPEREIDYNLVAKEISDIKNKLALLIEQAIILERKRQDNEEAALLLLIC